LFTSCNCGLSRKVIFNPEPSKMINVTVENFDAEVIEASSHTPVLVDFWAPWCGPCKVIGPLLEKIETEYAGRFKLVKIDSDQEQELGQAFGIRSIPTCVLLVGGKPVDGFTGALPEGQIKAFLDKHVPAQDILEAEVTGVEVSDAPALDDPVAVREALHQAVLKTPDNDDARFDYVKLLLTEGDTDGAKVAFAPVIAKTGLVRKFDSLQRWMNAIDFISTNSGGTLATATFDSRIAANKRDFDARFGKAQTLMAAQQWTAAMDELLEILMRDKAWSDELARKTFIAILDIIEPPKVKVADGQIPPADPTVATYRRRLSSVVLS
jgi:putative thioredoxin